MAQRSEAGRVREHLRAHGMPAFHLGVDAREKILGRVRSERIRGLARKGLAGEELAGGLGLHRLPAVSMAAAAVAVLILSAGFMALLPGMSPGGQPASSHLSGNVQDGPGGMWADYQDGQMVITWRGEGRQAFEVRHGQRVLEARTAPAERVEGTRYVTRALPEAQGAVFYVVE